MSNAIKIIGTTSLLAAVGYLALNAINRAKTAINNIQTSFAFVRVQGLIGTGITKFTNPVLQVVFSFQIRNLSEINLVATRIIATVQSSSDKGKTWSQIAISDNFANINVASGQQTNTAIALNFRGLNTLIGISNINTNVYRVIVSYQINGTNLQYVQNLPLQQYLKSSIDALKNAFALKGINNTLQLAG